MNKADLGTLTEVKDLRSIWPKEDKDFTQWLAQEENLNLLGDTLGLSLRLAETEKGVGKYFADIVAKAGPEDDDEEAEIVIIENQLETTNHDHLGKCIVYAAGEKASTIIWIAKECNEEHIAAVNWLNEYLDAKISFYLVQIKLYKIGDSKIAPKFEIICQPNITSKTTQDNKHSYAETELRISYLKFWEGFNSFLEEKKSNFNVRKAQPFHYHDLSINSSKCHLSLNVDHKSGALATRIWIPNNKHLYDDLYSHKDDIEADLAYSLNFDAKAGKKACAISVETKEFAQNYHDGNFGPCYTWLLEHANDFKQVFSRYIQ